MQLCRARQHRILPWTIAAATVSGLLVYVPTIPSLPGWAFLALCWWLCLRLLDRRMIKRIAWLTAIWTSSTIAALLVAGRAQWEYDLRTVLAASAGLALPVVAKGHFTRRAAAAGILASTAVVIGVAWELGAEGALLRPSALIATVCIALVLPWNSKPLASAAGALILGLALSLLGRSATPLMALLVPTLALLLPLRAAVLLSSVAFALVWFAAPESFHSRWTLIVVGLRLLSVYPLTGPGTGAFPLLSGLYGTPDEVHGATNTHNSLLQAALDYGSLAAVALLASVLWSAWRAWNMRQQSSGGLAAGTLAWLVMSSIEACFNATAIWHGTILTIASPVPAVLIGLSLGHAVGPAFRRHPNPPAEPMGCISEVAMFEEISDKGDSMHESHSRHDRTGTDLSRLVHKESI